MSERRVQIIASILAANFARLEHDVREAELAGADAIHVDVMDGHFVPNITVGPLVVRALRPVTSLPLHVHLMIEQPERYIEAFVKAGADLVTVHVETCPHLARTLEQIREMGARAAVTLNPATPLVSLEEVLDQVSVVLVMTVNPGFGGQDMLPGMLDKVRRLRGLLDGRGLACQIEVDGGINLETAAQAVRSGADMLVMGAAIYGHRDGVQTAIRELRALVSRV